MKVFRLVLFLVFEGIAVVSVCRHSSASAVLATTNHNHLRSFYAEVRSTSPSPVGEGESSSEVPEILKEYLRITKDARPKGLTPPIVFCNDCPFMYDDQSELVIEDFEGITTMSNLNIMYRITMVRKNGDNFYTVYSLKDRKLAYIKIIFRPETGTGFYVTDKIESQSGATDGKLEFVLEQDRPENILQID